MDFDTHNEPLGAATLAYTFTPTHADGVMNA
jgi:hypothetical protein